MSNNTDTQAEQSGTTQALGFLPAADPLRELPNGFAAWEDIATELPRLIVSGKVRERVHALPELAPDELTENAELRRAMLLLSFIGHAYVWGDREVANSIPAQLARPWHSVAHRLGRPPVLSYASYALDNYRRLDSEGPVELGNLALLQHFLGGADEEWFITVHIDIEAKAAPALRVLPELAMAAHSKDYSELTKLLEEVAGSLQSMYQTLCRTPEWCDPHTYFLRVRPFIFGWKNNPALPEGMLYEGVEAYSGAQFFRGETGAQSSIVPALDAALGIQHYPDPLREYLMEMRDYMPPEHRAFIEELERTEPLSTLVQQLQADEPALREAFNECVHYIGQFRSKHLEFASRYIHQQSQRQSSNPNSVGTGGTPFMRYLKKHRDETESHHVVERKSTRPA